MLALSRAIDRLNDAVGRWVSWLLLAAVLVSAANAVVRKAFDYSSNAFIEMQWYLFAAVFLLAAAHTLRRREHVRIDVITGRLPARTQLWVELFGTILFLLPLVVVVVDLSWPLFTRALASGEVSGNAGGLVRWPLLLLLPAGFVLLGLQGVSEVIKDVNALRGAGDDPGPAIREALPLSPPP
jgi:TRAP-type mannitol/chloroaromatic compound transport system permease small subunit